MVELKLWNNRRATYTSPRGEVYSGIVQREIVGKEVIIDGRTHRTFSYYLMADSGEKIKISNGSVTPRGFGLVSKLKSKPPFR